MTIPPETVAVALLLVHTPPGDGLVSVIVAPTHTLAGPEMVPALRNGPIVTILTADAVPQALVMEYMMVSSPGVTPTSKPPEEIVALLLLALQVPPATVSTRVVNVPAQITEAPVMVPGLGDRPTEIGLTATAVPQTVVTE